MTQVGKQNDTDSALTYFLKIFMVRNTEKKSEKQYHSQRSKRDSNCYINFTEEIPVHSSRSGKSLPRLN